MRSIFLKDMAYRRARVVLTAIGITVLVALILALGGIMHGMRIQARQFVESTGATIWISSEGSGGAFVGFSMLYEEYMAPLNHRPGIKPKSLSFLVFAHARPVIHEKSSKAIVVGYQQGKLGGPTRTMEGRMFTPSRFADYRPEDPLPLEVVVDERMDLEIGEQITIGGEKLKVVGKSESLMFVLDTPLLFMDLRAAQKVLFANYPSVNMVIAQTGDNFTPAQVAENLDEDATIEARTLKQTLDDIIGTYVTEPMKAVMFLRVMLWLASGILVAMITYVTTLEKTQEIGVLKAIGASNGYVVSLIIKQVALMSIVGIVIGVVLSYGFAFAAPIFVKIHLGESLVVAFISFLVCCASGYLAGRKAIAVDPMVAFRGEI